MTYPKKIKQATPSNIIIKPAIDAKSDTNAPLTAVFAKPFCGEHIADGITPMRATISRSPFLKDALPAPT
jgi:hypothetical protein